jgi:3-oxoacyl-[acyl-carrier protein] reductase
VAIAADVTSETEIVGAFKELETIDGLVISAGIFEGCSVEEMSLDFWKRTMDTNLTATFLAVREFVKARGDSELPGSIVIITSTAGQRGSAVFSAYATSKGAQLVFMRSMAKELAPRQIRVNCIAPAWTETEMADASLTDLGRESVIRDFPLGRIGQPADVANAAAFLLSDAAEFITGSTITVDGGFDMRG